MKLILRLHLYPVCNTDLYIFILCIMLCMDVCIDFCVYVYMYTCGSYIWMLKRTDLYMCVCIIYTWMNWGKKRPWVSIFEVQRIMITCLYFNCWPVREYQVTVFVELCWYSQSGLFSKWGHFEEPGTGIWYCHQNTQKKSVQKNDIATSFVSFY